MSGVATVRTQASLVWLRSVLKHLWRRHNPYSTISNSLEHSAAPCHFNNILLVLLQTGSTASGAQLLFVLIFFSHSKPPPPCSSRPPCFPIVFTHGYHTHLELHSPTLVCLPVGKPSTHVGIRSFQISQFPTSPVQPSRNAFNIMCSLRALSREGLSLQVPSLPSHHCVFANSKQHLRHQS